MTFQDISSDSTQSNWCIEAGNYNPLVPIVSDDSGDVSAIEDYLRLKYFSGGAHPGLGAAGGTPTKGALHHAGDSLEDTWTHHDPKNQCQRPYGIILCTDGLSNTCNTGATPDQVWEPVDYYGNPTANTPCEDDQTGTDFVNYPPSEAEAVYNRAFNIPGGDIIKPRTYAIGIAPEVGRCELNRIAYRGRSDARAARGDAGFLLYDPSIPVTSCALVGDKELPHIDAATTPPDESGPTPPAANRFRQDNPGPGYDPAKPDYAFFALDTATIVDAFLTIVASTATGDYSTSAPVSGGAIALGNVVLLPSTDYPTWTRPPARPRHVAARRRPSSGTRPSPE